jgi:hypothetical protein
VTENTISPRGNLDTKPTELMLLESRDKNMISLTENLDTRPTELMLVESRDKKHDKPYGKLGY